MTEHGWNKGCAFDSNMLKHSTQRRLMSLWMESTGCSTVVLPTVYGELCPHLTGESRHPTSPGAMENERVWERESERIESPFQMVRIKDSQWSIYHEVIDGFTLECFPNLSHLEEIPTNRDSKIIAEAVATDTPMIVTNNMISVDHHEVNELLKVTRGFNERFVKTADNAMLDAHPSGEASRKLLIMGLASCWPDDLRPLDFDECEGNLAALRDRLTRGAGMSEVAAKMHNVFITARNLDMMIEEAHDLATYSTALATDRLRIHALRQAAGRKAPANDVGR